MKTLLIGLGLALAVSASAADPRGRVDTRRLAGQINYTQDLAERDAKPVWVLNSLFYNITNLSDGVVLVRSNATVLVHIVLPNPTNNINRRFEIHTLGASTAVLSNAVTGSFTEMTTMAHASTYSIASNKTAVVYSTGTNYVARVY